MEKLTQEELKKIKFSPITNPKVISIIQQEDGNYKGFTQKNGKLIQVREGDPTTVVQALIVHP